MNLIFERGDRSAPAGHAFVYFRTGEDAIYASYIIVSPIAFDPSAFTPPALAPLLQGLDLGAATMAMPMPPLPQEVPNAEYLLALAERRNDDLLFAGTIIVSSPALLMPELAEASSAYGDLYAASALPDPELPVQPPIRARYDGLSEAERIDELTSLTGRLRDSLSSGAADPAILDLMRELADSLPPKYRAPQLIRAAQTPGPEGQTLAQLYLERCYTLLREEYLELERIDREIEAGGG